LNAQVSIFNITPESDFIVALLNYKKLAKRIAAKNVKKSRILAFKALN